MDFLYINQLMIMTRVGVYNWEKKCLQKIIFDLKLMYVNDFNLNTFDYLDYTKVSKTIVDFINTRYFTLIEEIAELVSKLLIEKFAKICQVQIKVSKLGAIYNARNVSIYMKRNRLNNLKPVNIYIGWRS